MNDPSDARFVSGESRVPERAEQVLAIRGHDAIILPDRPARRIIAGKALNIEPVLPVFGPLAIDMMFSGLARNGGTEQDLVRVSDKRSDQALPARNPEDARQPPGTTRHRSGVREGRAEIDFANQFSGDLKLFRETMMPSRPRRSPIPSSAAARSQVPLPQPTSSTLLGRRSKSFVSAAAAPPSVHVTAPTPGSVWPRLRRLSFSRRSRVAFSPRAHIHLRSREASR